MARVDINDMDLAEHQKKAFAPKQAGSYDNKARRAYMAQPNVKAFNKVFVKKALSGQAYKWDNVEVLQNQLNDYFDLCAETDTVPTITAIATWLHCNRDTIYKHANNPNSPFQDILKNVINMCHTSLENGAVDNKVNPAVYIFMGKNYFGLKDDKQITVSPNSDKQLVNSGEVMDAIQKQIAEENIPNANVVKEEVMPKKKK